MAPTTDLAVQFENCREAAGKLLLEAVNMQTNSECIEDNLGFSDLKSVQISECVVL